MDDFVVDSFPLPTSPDLFDFLFSDFLFSDGVGEDEDWRPVGEGVGVGTPNLSLSPSPRFSDLRLDDLDLSLGEMMEMM